MGRLVPPFKYAICETKPTPERKGRRSSPPSSHVGIIGQVCHSPTELDSNGTARVGGGHRGVTEIVRSLESTVERA